MTTQSKTLIKVPTIQELYEEKGDAIKQSQLNMVLNAEPKPEWVKFHPFVNDLKYLPIERVEYLLTMIFGKWRVEVQDVKILANSIVTSVRLYVKDPISGEWDWQDGVGASPIQIKKGFGAVDFAQMNSSAIQIGAPASESYAIKDAAEKFGRIFGKDLNRKDTISYIDRLQGHIDAMTKMEILKQIEEVKDKTALRMMWLDFNQKERDDKDIKSAYESKDESLQ
jgi:hypothetical protein